MSFGSSDSNRLLSTGGVSWVRPWSLKSRPTVAKAYPLRYDPSLFRLAHEKGKGDPGQILPQGEEGSRRLLVERPRGALVASLIRHEALQLPPASLVDPQPGEDGRAAN